LFINIYGSIYPGVPHTYLDQKEFNFIDNPKSISLIYEN